MGDIEQLSNQLVAIGIQATVAPHIISPEAIAEQNFRTRQYLIEKRERRDERLAKKKALQSYIEQREKPIFEKENFAWIRFEGSNEMEKLLKLTEELTTSEEAVYGAIVGSVPVFRQLPNWREKVREKVLSILRQAADDLDDGVFLEALFDENAEEEWYPAFTDYTWNPNEGQNYELSEKTGDSTAKTGLLHYLIEAGRASGRHIGEHEMTVAVNTILAKQEQARVSREMGLPKLLRTIYDDLTVGQEEDVFESFFGATYMSGEKQNIGQALCTRLIYWMVDSDLIHIPERFQTPYKTQIVTVFSTYGWGEPQSQTRREGKDFITYLFLSDQAKRSAGRNITVLDIYDAKRKMIEGTPYPTIDQSRLQTIIKEGGLIGTGRGINRDVSKVAAYRSAVSLFRELGIIRDVEYQERVKLNQAFHVQLEKPFFAALKKAISEGYDNIYAADARPAVGRDVALLYGIKDNPSSKRVIYMISLPDSRDAKTRQKEPRINKTQLRRILYEKYAEDRRTIRSGQVGDEDDEMLGVSRPNEDDMSSDEEE